MPFATEELWQAMGFGKKDPFYRIPPSKAAELAKHWPRVGSHLRGRSPTYPRGQWAYLPSSGIKAEYNVASARRCNAVYLNGNDSSRSIVAANMDTIKNWQVRLP